MNPNKQNFLPQKPSIKMNTAQSNADRLLNNSLMKNQKG